MNNIDGKEDGYWTVEEIRHYIIDELKNRFPNSIIMRELSSIDIMILKEDGCIPVEIQKTYAIGNRTSISSFEDRTRRQIERNINIYDICWLFLDNNFLEHLMHTSSRTVSFDMRWLYKYYREGKVNIFSITRDGIIKELKDEDLNILTKFTINDLSKNKSSIVYNVLKWKGFTTEEINEIYSNFERYNMHSIKKWLHAKGRTQREREFGTVYSAFDNLYGIESILNCSAPDNNSLRFYMSSCRTIGLFSSDYYDKYKSTIFTDELDIAKYFDGYENNKELWEYIREYPVDNRTLNMIVKGKYPNYLKDRNMQKNIDDCWN